MQGRANLVFAGDLDRHRYPIRTRTPGMLVGTLVMVAVAVSLVSPRTIAFSLPLIGISVLLSTWWQRRMLDLLPETNAGGYLLVALLAFGALSALWADKPAAAFGAVITASAYLIVCAISSAGLSTEPRHQALHIAEGFWIGLFAGLVYLAIEIHSGQAIKLALYHALDVPKSWLRPASNFKWRGDVLVAISPMDLTRNIAPISLLVWSAMLALKPTAPGGRVKLWTSLLFALAGFVTFTSEHETSKVAFVFGGLVFAFAAWRPTWSIKFLMFAWVASCLAVIPVTLALHRLDLHTSERLQFTLRHRVVIWNYTAEQALKSPLVGIGAGMMYQLDPTGVKPDPESNLNAAVPHAHNIYLQTWFELGAVGAALLTLVGLSILDRIRRLGTHIAPYAHATFASAMVMAAASYGMWQAWFIAMFALCAVMFLVALRVNLPETLPAKSSAD